MDIDSSFIYLSQIISLPVYSSGSGRKIGYIDDVSAAIKRAYPKVSALIMKKKFKRGTYYVPWDCVDSLEAGRGAFIKCEPDVLENQIDPAGSEMLLKETFWDNQIVDTAGSKVVRVNDLHLMKDKSNLWLVHIDIGFSGFLRRLGWHGHMNRTVKWLFDYNLKDRFISWKNIQPITTTNIYGSISLKIPYSKLSEMHPADIADVLTELGTDERIIIMKSLDRPTAAQSIQELPLNIRVQTVEMLGIDDLKKIIEEMDIDEIVDLFKELSEDKLQSLFAALPQETVTEIKALLIHSESSAGSLMNTQYVSVQHDVTIREILQKVKKEHDESESIYYIYVLNDDGSLAGVTTLREILGSKKNTQVSEVMHRNMIKVKIDTDVKKVARVFFKYDFVMVPVVDDANRMMGVISIKDALKSVFPEMDEDNE